MSEDIDALLAAAVAEAVAGATAQLASGTIVASRTIAASDAIGVGPKTLSRIVRFNRALGLSRQDKSDWADIAADCGYADQAHLVREFRDLGGQTPTAIADLK